MIAINEAATVTINSSVDDAIRHTIGALPAETGGVLGKDPDGVIRHFHFDASGQQTGGTYSPDTTSLAMLMRAWNRQGIRLAGFVHSHPRGFDRPSGGDLVYAQRILEHNKDLDALVLPIVMPERDGHDFEITGFQAVRTPDLPVIEEIELAVEPLGVKSSINREQNSLVDPALIVDVSGKLWPQDHTFDRVVGAYDLHHLGLSRLICVGVGGAASFVCDAARSGVREFILIDPDIVSDTNLATQNVFRRDIGRAKVDCVRAQIHDINPCAVVRAFNKKLEDIDDATFEQMAFSSLQIFRGVSARLTAGSSGANLSLDVAIHPEVTLLCGMTDDFYTQARVNRLALHFRLPSLCAQVYARGCGAEITFTYPGVTPACHRCILKSRYEAYLVEGFENDVTSDGTPIFSTTVLNGVKGYIAMALLHHGCNHPRWGGILRRIHNRNLIQIRMEPDLNLPSFRKLPSDDGHLSHDALFMERRPWIATNDSPGCPDCGGFGDLRTAKGTFPDTRVMRQ